MTLALHILAYWFLASIVFGAVWAFAGWRITCLQEERSK